MSFDIIQEARNGWKLIHDQTSTTVSYLDGTSKLLAAKMFPLARTHTGSTNMFTLPGDAIPVRVYLQSVTNSNAQSTATISVGVAGSTTYLLNGYDVRSSNGFGSTLVNPVLNLFNGLGSSHNTDVQVVGTYAETGGASTVGGPWNVVIEYYVP